MKIILIKSPNNETDRVPARYHLSSNEASNIRNWEASNWVVGKKSAMEITKQPRVSCQNSGFVFAKWQLGPIVEDNTHKILWMWRGQVRAYIKLILLCSSVYDMEKHTAGYQKRKINTNPTSKPLSYNLSCLKKYARTMVAQTLLH